MQKLIIFLIALTILTFSSCSDDDPVSPPDDQPTALNAKAGLNQEAEINETVTLDGSKSTGPSGFTYSWTYTGKIPESEINFQNKTTAKPTFVLPSAGLYEFTLTIAHGDSSNSDETTVLVGGAIELGGTLTEDLKLRNIQSDASKPDYIVKSDLVVPAGITLSIVEDDVKIGFESETGIYVDGGKITNETEGQDDSFLTEFFGENGWKGIWVKDGEININHSLIINTGSAKFSGLEEAAAVTLSGGTTQLTSFSDNSFINSVSYDINVIDKFPEISNSFMRNKFSFKIPIKAVITFLGFWSSDGQNIMPETFDYVHLIPSGANTKDVINNPNGFGFYPRGVDFFIDGDFWAGSYLSFGNGSTIYIKENSGILVGESLWSAGTENDSVTFTGINGTNWKGFAAFELGSRSFKFSRIINAGHGLMNIGEYTTKKEAAFYTARIVGARFENSEISNSNGFGYYNEQTELVADAISNTVFKNCKKAAIGINLASINQVLRSGHNNKFELEDGVPAVLVSKASLPPSGGLYELGNGNYYLMDTNWEFDADFVINEGVYLKFKA